MNEKPPADTLRVWDLPTRLFHWLLVGAITGALATGLSAPTTWIDVHTYLGYGIAGLVVFRVIWGVFGGHYSRFRSFIYAPRQTLGHFLGLLRRRPQHFFGHNPSGAAMIFVLLAALTALAVTGLISLGGANKAGPLSGVASYAAGQAAVGVHEILAYGLMVLIAAHILGVVAESFVGRENLVASMFSGDKDVPAGTKVGNVDRPRPVAAFVCSLAVLAVIGPGVVLLARMPPLGVPSFPMNPQYAAECGDCHYAYSPSLLPEKSWRGLMATLDDHFGEDASLEPEDTAKIQQWLIARSAEHWDTEAAVRFREVSQAAPWQITAIPFWRDRHRDIEPAVFSRKKIGVKGNCIACHSDADGGQFYGGAIEIPE